MVEAGASTIKPLCIGVTGGTASGKSTLCKRIMNSDIGQKIALVSLDMFYKGLSADQNREDIDSYNFDHPDAIDFDCAFTAMTDLLNGQSTEIPTYDVCTARRTDVKTTINPAPIILFEGIHAFHESRFRDIMDLKVFVYCPDDIRLGRRIARDTTERNCTL